MGGTAPVIDAPAVLRAAQDVLSPYVGEKTARTTTSELLRKLKIGIVEDQMTAEQLEALLGGLATGVAVFVGQAKADTLIEQIRARFRAPAGA